MKASFQACSFVAFTVKNREFWKPDKPSFKTAQNCRLYERNGHKNESPKKNSKCKMVYAAFMDAYYHMYMGTLRNGG